MTVGDLYAGRILSSMHKSVVWCPLSVCPMYFIKMLMQLRLILILIWFNTACVWFSCGQSLTGDVVLCLFVLTPLVVNKLARPLDLKIPANIYSCGFCSRAGTQIMESGPQSDCKILFSLARRKSRSLFSLSELF